MTNYSSGTVSVINAATHAVTATIPVGSKPAGVAVDPAAGTVYVTNQGEGTVSVIDAAAGTVTATIPVGTDPDGVAVDPATHTAYVANLRDGTVSVISAARAPTALTARIGLSPRLTLTATLTAAGQPLSGQPVSFSTGPTHLCTRDTSTRGVANCVLTLWQTVQVLQALQAGHDHDNIRASYPGNTSYQPSSATAGPPTTVMARSLARRSGNRGNCSPARIRGLLRATA